MGNQMSNEKQMKASEVKALSMKRCGWLMKSGLSNTHLQKRWCAIYELKLFYYESPRSEIPNGVIDLRGAMVKKCSNPKFGFEIETGGMIQDPNIRRRTFLFVASGVDTKEASLSVDPRSAELEQRQKDRNRQKMWMKWISDEIARTFI